MFDEKNDKQMNAMVRSKTDKVNKVDMIESSLESHWLHLMYSEYSYCQCCQLNISLFSSPQHRIFVPAVIARKKNAERVEAAFRFGMMYHVSKMVLDTHV